MVDHLKFNENLSYIATQTITASGYIFSSMAIAVHAFIHFSTDLFRNLPGNMLMSNCLLLLLQYLFSSVFMTLSHTPWEQAENTTLHFFDYYYTAYIWSILTRVQFIMAFDMWRCFRTNTKLSPQNTRRFIKYQLFCWLSPFAELLLLWMLKRLTSRKPLSECLFCLDSDLRESVLFNFFVMDALMMLFNFSFYACCVYYIHKTRSQVRNASSQQSSGFTFYCKICGRLFIMSEMNYTLLILVYHFKFGLWLKSIFTVFMAYHGLVVFFFIVLQKTLLKRTATQSKSESENTTGPAITTGVTMANLNAA